MTYEHSSGQAFNAKNVAGKLKDAFISQMKRANSRLSDDELGKIHDECTAMVNAASAEQPASSPAQKSGATGTATNLNKQRPDASKKPEEVTDPKK